MRCTAIPAGHQLPMDSSIFTAAPRPGQVTPPAPSPRLPEACGRSPHPRGRFPVRRRPRRAAPPAGSTSATALKAENERGAHADEHEQDHADPHPIQGIRAEGDGHRAAPGRTCAFHQAAHPLITTAISGPPGGADRAAVLLDAATSLSARAPSTMANSPVSSVATWPRSARWTATAPRSPRAELASPDAGTARRAQAGADVIRPPPRRPPAPSLHLACQAR